MSFEQNEQTVEELGHSYMAKSVLVLQIVEDCLKDEVLKHAFFVIMSYPQPAMTEEVIDELKRVMVEILPRKYYELFFEAISIHSIRGIIVQYIYYYYQKFLKDDDETSQAEALGVIAEEYDSLIPLYFFSTGQDSTAKCYLMGNENIREMMLKRKELTKEEADMLEYYSNNNTVLDFDSTVQRLIDESDVKSAIPRDVRIQIDAMSHLAFLDFAKQDTEVLYDAIAYLREDTFFRDRMLNDGTVELTPTQIETLNEIQQLGTETAVNIILGILDAEENRQDNQTDTE